MPYGNYSSENKTGLLVEHIIKDIQFLLSHKYYKSATDTEYEETKQPVKSIVIACNTATAYGRDFVMDFISKTGIELKVIGVIDAGVRGTLATLEKDESGSIGVMATVGTIESKGYENTILRIKEEMGYTGDIQIFSQGGHGIAEAVDEEPDFINNELYNYKNGAKYVYRNLMQKEIEVVDPAINVADELYTYLKEKKLFNPSGDINNSEFYISVPNSANPNIQLDQNGRFPYNYKYGRTEGEIQEYIKVVPFSKENITEETLSRFKKYILETFKLIKEFNHSNPKTEYLTTSAKITN